MNDPTPSRKRQRTTAPNFMPKYADVKLQNEAIKPTLIDDGEDTTGELLQQLQFSISAKNTTMKQQNRELKERNEELERQIFGYSINETNFKVAITRHDNYKKQLDEKVNKLQFTNEESEKKIKSLEEQLESKAKAETEFQKNIAGLKDYNAKIDIDYKNALKEIKKLKDEHVKEMADIKARIEKKFNDDMQVYAAEISALTGKNADICKNLSAAQSIFAQHQKAFDQQIAKAKATENGLHRKIYALEAKDRNACHTITTLNQKNQTLEKELKEAKAKLGVRYVTLDQIRDGSTLSALKIFINCNSTVLKIAKLTQGHGCWNLYSTDNPNEQPVMWKTAEYIKNTVLHFEIHGELDLNEADFNMLLPRLHFCSLTKLNLHGTVVSLDVFKKLAGSKTIHSFKNVIAKGGYGIMLKFYVMLKELPNISIFEMDEIDTPIISEMCESLEHLPAFPNLQRFTLKPLDPSFNLLAFGSFIKNNPAAEFELQYCGLSQNERNAVVQKEEEFRKSLPANSKVVLKY